jgi:hypothetical protein
MVLQNKWVLIYPLLIPFTPLGTSLFIKLLKKVWFPDFTWSPLTAFSRIAWKTDFNPPRPGPPHLSPETKFKTKLYFQLLGDVKP